MNCCYVKYTLHTNYCQIPQVHMKSCCVKYIRTVAIHINHVCSAEIKSFKIWFYRRLFWTMEICNSEEKRNHWLSYAKLKNVYSNKFPHISVFKYWKLYRLAGLSHAAYFVSIFNLCIFTTQSKVTGDSRPFSWHWNPP